MLGWPKRASEPTPPVYPPPKGVRIAAAGTVSGKTDGSVNAAAQYQSWWADAEKVGNNPIANRIINDMLYDITAARLSVTRDGVTPEGLATEFLGNLESPLDTGLAQWHRAVTFMLRWGRVVWGRTTIDNAPEAWRAWDGWSSLPGGETWICYAGPNFRVNAEIAECRHQSGELIKYSQSDIVVCTWWDNISPGGITSLLRQMLTPLAINEKAFSVIAAALEKERQNRSIITVSDQLYFANGGELSTSGGDMSSAVSLARVLQDELTAKSDRLSLTDSADTSVAIVIPVDDNSEPPSIVKLDTEMSPSLLAALRESQNMLAIAADTPTSVLTGEVDRYANVYATRQIYATTTLRGVTEVIMEAMNRLYRAMFGYNELRLMGDVTPLIAANANAADNGTFGEQASRQQPTQQIAAAAITKKKDNSLNVAAVNDWQTASVEALRACVAEAERVAIAINSADPGTDIIALRVRKSRNGVAKLFNILKGLDGLAGSGTDPTLMRSRAAEAFAELVDDTLSEVQDVEANDAVAAGLVSDSLKLITKDIAKSLLGKLTDKLFGPSRHTSSDNPTLIDRPGVTGPLAMDPDKLLLVASWTPPGEPDRDPFAPHLKIDGHIWDVANEPPPAHFGHDANGSRCQCVWEIYSLANGG